MTTSGLLVAHAGLAAGARAGFRPWGAVGWGGAGGARPAPGTACCSTTAASFPGPGQGRGYAALGLLQARWGWSLLPLQGTTSKAWPLERVQRLALGLHRELAQVPLH